MLRFLVLSALVACAFGNSILPRFASPTGRIVGGHNTTIDKHPYQVSVRGSDGLDACGGSIISSRKILTAAHCFISEPSMRLTIQYGVTKTGTQGNVIAVKKTKRHPKYNSKGNDNNDVAVLTLYEDIPFSETARPIPLAKEEPKAGAKAVVTGWGYLEEPYLGMFGKSPETLQEVEIKILDRKECKRLYGNYKEVDDSMVCTFDKKGDKDACQGDSGGPIVVDDILVGVVSWGYGCARHSSPGVYANVAGLRDWILRQ